MNSSNAAAEPFLRTLQSHDLHDPFNGITVGAAFFNLVTQLADNLIDYDLIVGDDTGGRIPALVMRRVINHARADHGLPKPHLRFATGRYSTEKVPKSFIPEKDVTEARTLIVTEGIYTGSHVTRLGKIINTKREPEEIDIASLGLFFGPLHHNPIEGAQLYFGDTTPTPDTMTSAPYRFYRSNFGGVVTHYTNSMFASRNVYTDQYIVNRTRAEAIRFADVLSEYTLADYRWVPPYPIHTPDTEKVLV